MTSVFRFARPVKAPRMTRILRFSSAIPTDIFRVSRLCLPYFHYTATATPFRDRPRSAVRTWVEPQDLVRGCTTVTNVIAHSFARRSLAGEGHAAEEPAAMVVSAGWGGGTALRPRRRAG